MASPETQVTELTAIFDNASVGILFTRNRARQSMRAALLGLALLVFTLPILWTVLASFRIVPDNFQSPPAWTPPTLAGTTLYVRDRKTIAAFALGK